MMKPLKLLTFAALAASLLSSGFALAGPGHWHSSIGIYVGPGFGPYYHPYYRPYYPYGDPYYYGYAYPYPPVVVAPPVVQSPPVYVEQQAPQVTAPEQSASQDNYWYHCDKPEGYYPYIKECAAGWQRVAPQPPK